MRRALSKIAASGLLLLLAACGTTGGPGASGGGIFSNEADGRAAWDSRSEGRSWSQMTRLAIDTDGAALLAATPADIEVFCPNYANLTPQAKREVWVVLVAQIAQIESALDPMAVKNPPGPGQAQARRGLMQISVDTAQRYRCANVGPMQLNDPQTSLGCGVKILAATSGADKIVTGYTQGGWKGAARYWVDLRRPENVADLQAATNGQTFCRRKTS